MATKRTRASPVAEPGATLQDTPSELDTEVWSLPVLPNTHCGNTEHKEKFYSSLSKFIRTNLCVCVLIISKQKCNFHSP